MKLIKTVKLITKVVVIMIVYSFIGGVVFSAHDHFYPEKTRSTTGPIDFSVAIGAGWPVLVPLWGATELGRVFARLGSTAIEDLTSEQND